MTKNLGKSILWATALAFLGSSAAEAISTNFIKRLGKSCTGVCDQPSVVCGDDKDTIKWCKKNCGHKIDVEEVCKKKATPTNGSDCSKTKYDQTKVHALAAAAAKHAYDYGAKGGFKGPDFEEVMHKKSKSTDVHVWVGYNKEFKTLFIAYKGTSNARDVVKDAQIGVAHLANLVGLGGFASRGEYNNAINWAVEYYHKAVEGAKNKDVCRIVITGHSLGGGIAQNVADRVARGQKNVEVVTLNAPGTDFHTNKAGSGHEDVKATHIRSPGDVVSKWGNTTEGETVTTRGGSSNPLTAHSSEGIAKELDKKAKRDSK